MVIVESIEDRINKARKFIENIQGYDRQAMKAYSYFIGDEAGIMISVGACHASLKDLKDRIVLTGGLIPVKSQMEDCELFLKWICSEKSPWYSITKNIEIIRVNNLVNGWLIQGDDLKNAPFYLLKNFCILTRSFTERYDSWRFWANLVRKGVNPGDAFYLCSCFQQNDRGLVTLMDLRSGGHWAFTHSREKVDFDLLRGNKQQIKEVKSDTTVVNLTFLKQPVERDIPFQIQKIPSHHIEGSIFSRAMGYDVQEILEAYYKWQDEEGSLSV